MDAGISGLQNLITGLHPPQLDDLGLLAALRWYSNQVSERSNLPVSIQSNGNDRWLPDDIRLVIFRIAQEAITNTVRHASASRIIVQLECTGSTIRMTIEDDGCGFAVEQTLQDATRPHWGLLGMLERALLIQAGCQIISTPGKGTQVIVVWNGRKANG